MNAFSRTSLGLALVVSSVGCGGPSKPFDTQTSTTEVAATTSAPAPTTTPAPSTSPPPSTSTSAPATVPSTPAAPVVLPPAPVEPNVAQPAGEVGGLTVLDWAGYTAAVSYTFDDTNSSQIEHYAALNALGVHYTFYLQTNKSELSDPVWKQAILDGHEIGNHSHSHQETDDGTDVDKAQTEIQTELGVTAYTMAAPMGKAVYADIAATRFLINRGVSNGLVGAGDNTDRFDLPCFIPDEEAPADDFNKQVDSAVSAKSWRTVLVHGFTGGSDSAYQPVAIEEFVAAVQYAKDLKTVWLDSVVNVGAYWLGQKAFAAATPTTSGTDQVWTWTLPEHFPPGHVLRVTVTGGKLSQNGTPLVWDSHGYYEVSLDAKSLTLSP
jgi:hypothetical protein